LLYSEKYDLTVIPTEAIPAGCPVARRWAGRAKCLSGADGEESIELIKISSRQTGCCSKDYYGAKAPI